MFQVYSLKRFEIMIHHFNQIFCRPLKLKVMFHFAALSIRKEKVSEFILVSRVFFPDNKPAFFPPMSKLPGNEVG